mgnify:CR=1 FL=1
MVDVIDEFLAERKAAWLKAKLKADMNETAQQDLYQEATDKFSLSTWLPDAAKRVTQLSMVSHPSKFSHPSAKTSSVIAYCSSNNDGYLRTGNVNYPLDVFGNAAAMDVYKFLSLTLADGQTVLTHIENDSEVIKPILTINTANYDELKQGFISIKQADSSIKTDRLVKQVYFPVVENYHLLSILTPSGLLTKIKTTIDKMRFSDESKEAKAQRKDNKYHPTGFDDLLDLSVTAYGGTQPQNISVLNSQNAGRAYLLPSTPPTLQKRDIRLPTYDFFKNSLWRGQFKDNFDALHKLMILDINNINIREAINRRIKFVIDQILEKAFVIRASNIGWSETEHYKQLPLAQRIWLDDIHLEQRTNQELWLEAVSRSFAGWIVHSYEASQKNNGAIILSSTESNHIRQFVEEAISQDKEFF